MTTTFDQFQRELAASGRLWPSPVHIDRGQPFNFPMIFEGDWSGAQMWSAIRSQPDQEPIVATLAVAGPDYDAINDLTTFTLSLTEAQTAALPPDPTGEAITRLAWDVLFQPAGLARARLTGREITVLGRITNV